jgi:hypothetical protein
MVWLQAGPDPVRAHHPDPRLRPDRPRGGAATRPLSALAYFDTGRASNGGTEAINGLIELHRRIARGFRNHDNYRLRMLLIGGGLDQPHQK